jgi:hypothetical protein
LTHSYFSHHHAVDLYCDTSHDALIIVPDRHDYYDARKCRHSPPPFPRSTRAAGYFAAAYFISLDASDVSASRRRPGA